MSYSKKKIEEELAYIDTLHPYWQKIEWFKIKVENPELYEALLEAANAKSK